MSQPVWKREQVSEHWPTKEGLAGAAAFVVTVMACALVVYLVGWR